MESGFHFVCGIKGCAHSFKFGSTFSSFKSHATRKHPNWQESVAEAENVIAEASIPHTSQTLTTDPERDANQVESADQQAESQSLNVCEPELSSSVPSAPCPESVSCRSAQETTALFFLAFKEQYKLPQTAVNVAVGFITSILTTMCATLQESMHV